MFLNVENRAKCAYGKISMYIFLYIQLGIYSNAYRIHVVYWKMVREGYHLKRSASGIVNNIH